MAGMGDGGAVEVGEPVVSYPVTEPNYALISSFSPDDDPGLADRLADLEREWERARERVEAEQRRAASRPSISLRGRAHLDTALFSGSALETGNFADNTENGTKFRRTRLGANGGMFDVYRYQIEMDFADSRASFRDVYLEMTDLPLLQTIRIGHFKEPASLEELVSSNHITFMERSVLNAFIPARNVGIQTSRHNDAQTATFAMGFFRDGSTTPPTTTNQNGGNSLTLRGTMLPWYDEASEGSRLFHAGGFYSYRDVDRDGLRFRQRPDNSFSDRIVDTGLMADAVDWHLLGVELAMVHGPFSVQSEYVKALVTREEAADPGFDALYVEFSYWLTGEHRVYRRSSGRFDRVTPHTNFFRIREDDGSISMGPGAWQVAYRFGYIDLIDASVDGGRANVHTMGLNWHLTRNARLMANYVHANRIDEDASYLNAVTMRAQFDF